MNSVFQDYSQGSPCPKRAMQGARKKTKGLDIGTTRAHVPLALKSQSRAARAASLLWTPPPRGEAHSVTGSFLHLHPKLGTAAALQELSAPQGQQAS